MMPLVEVVASVVVCGFAGACGDPVEPALPGPNVTISSSGECVRVTFEITSSTTVTGTYPGASCPTVGLIVAKPSSMSWVGATRTLTIPMMVRNTTTLPIQLPLRLELPVDGKVVMLPAGTSNSKLVALGMDSTLAADRKLWLIGGSGTLAPGDSTTDRNLTFPIDVPVTKGRFWFVSQGEEIPAFPSAAPDSQPAWFTVDTSFTPGGVLKRAIGVQFLSGATLVARAEAVDSVGGVVVGGKQRGPGEEGLYYVHVPGATTEDSLVSLIRTIKRQPSVGLAVIISAVELHGRRPSDGTGWTPADWSLARDSASGENWALEQLAMPLAWGCELGSSGAKIGIVDRQFRTSIDYAANVVGGFGPVDTATISHGTMVALTVGAVGDNGFAGAGATWRAGLLLEPVGYGGNQVDAAKAVRNLIGRGARVINLSIGARYDPTRAPATDSSIVQGWVSLVGQELLSVPPAQRPLLVVSAGNDNRSAWLSGAPALKDVFPDDVVVVGASDSALARWGGASPVPGTMAGSNHGVLVDVFAPGVNVKVRESSTLLINHTGTSVSAPLVAGIAAQLAAFDPGLTNSEIRSLIANGAVAGARAVTNGAGKYVANAYESLKAAAQKPGVPICGNEVGIDSTGALVAVRGQGTEQIAPPGAVVWRVSVAQGGRLVAGTFVGAGPDPVVRTYRLQGGSWQAGAQSAAGVYAVQYLERDTAILKLKTLGTYGVGGPLTLTITGPSGGAVQNLDLGTRVGAANSIFRLVKVSPDAQWVAFMSQQGGNRYYADSVGGGHLTALRSSLAQAGCSPFSTVFPPGTLCVDAPFTADDGDLNWDPAGQWAGLLDRTLNVSCPISGPSCFGLHTLYGVRFHVATRSVVQVRTDSTWADGSLLSGDGMVWRECQDHFIPQTSTFNLRTVYRSPTTFSILSTSPGCLRLRRPALQNLPALAREAGQPEP